MLVAQRRQSLTSYRPEWFSASSLIAAYVVIRYVYIAIFASGAISTVLDELLTLILLPLAVLCLARFSGRWKLMLFGFVGYAALGVVSAIVNDPGGVPQPIGAMADILLDAKLVIMVLGFYYLLNNRDIAYGNVNILCGVLLGIGLLNSPFVLVDSFLGGGYGIHGQRLLARLGFFQPNGLVNHHLESCQLTMLAGFSALYFFKRRGGPFYLGLSIYLSVIFFLHVSAKEMVAYVICLLFFVIGRPGRTPYWILSLPFWALAAAALVTFSPIGDVLMSQMQNYVITNRADQVRTILTTGSIDYASHFFPLGAGAGTYASPPSIQMGYSNLYYAQGLGRMWGASPENPKFLLDVFWPKVLAQTGYFGVVFFGLFLLGSILPSLKLFFRRRDEASWFCLSVILTAVMMSVAATPFSQENIAPIMAFCIAYGVAGERAWSWRRLPRPIDGASLKEILAGRNTTAHPPGADRD
jgi:uncharacterized membrane protein YhaH (DUF805 family)